MRPSGLSTLALGALLALAAPAVAAAQSFTDIGAGITNVRQGSSIWGDYDGDLDLDLLITGEQTGNTAFADIFQKGAGATFTALGAGLTGISVRVGLHRSAWGDFDNDGDLDVIITGFVGSSPSTKLYKNTAGVFTAEAVTPSGIINVANGSARWGDYDNDGDLDLFVTGYGNALVTTVYRNDGANATGGWTFVDIDPFATLPNAKRVQRRLRQRHVGGCEQRRLARPGDHRP
jgi:hypothetical protein